VKIHPRTAHEGPEKGQRNICTRSLISALDGGGWSTLLPDNFPAVTETQYPLYRRLGRSGHMCENLAPHRDSIFRPSSPLRVAIPTTLSRSTFSVVHVPCTTFMELIPLPTSGYLVVIMTHTYNTGRFIMFSLITNIYNNCSQPQEN
jgi:hypothetical protein